MAADKIDNKPDIISAEELEQLKARADEANRQVKNLQNVISLYTNSLVEGREKTDELIEAFRRMGVSISVLSQEDFQRLSESIKFIAQNLETLPEGIRKQIERLKPVIDDMDQKVSSFGERVKEIVKGVSEDTGKTIKTTFNDITKAVESELSNLFPPGMARAGIYGLLAGLLIGTANRFVAESNAVLAAWKRFIPDLGLGELKGQVDGLSESIQSMYRDWMFVLDKRELIDLWSMAGLAIRDFKGSLEDARPAMRSLIEDSLQTDMVVGRIGFSLQHANEMFVRMGVSVRETVDDMLSLQSSLVTSSVPFNVMLQNVIDLQNRLGFVGADLRTIGNLFGNLTRNMEDYSGGLEVARTATGELLGGLEKLSVPLRAVAGMGVFGEQPAEIIYRYAQTLYLRPEEFGERTGELISNLLQRFGIFRRLEEGIRPEELFLQLSTISQQLGLGWSERTITLLTSMFDDWSRKGLTVDKDTFVKLFSDNTDLQRSIKEDGRSLKSLLEDTVPAWTKLLTSMRELLIEILSSITDLILTLTGYILAIFAPGAGITFEEMREFTAGRLIYHRDEFVRIGRQLGDSLSGFTEGIGEFIDLFGGEREIGIVDKIKKSIEEIEVPPGTLGETMVMGTPGGGALGGAAIGLRALVGGGERKVEVQDIRDRGNEVELTVTETTRIVAPKSVVTEMQKASVKSADESAHTPASGVP